MSYYRTKKLWEDYHEEVENIQKCIVCVDGIEYIANDSKVNIMMTVNRHSRTDKLVLLYEINSDQQFQRQPHMRLSTRGKRVGLYNFSKRKWTNGGHIVKEVEPLKEGEIDWITIESVVYMIDWEGNVYSEDEELVGIYDRDKKIWIKHYHTV